MKQEQNTIRDTIQTPWYKHYDGVRPHLDYPEGSLYELIAKGAGEHPDYISYMYFGTKRTYRDFIEEIDRCAEAFLVMGYGKGDYISICMPNTPEAIIAFYAINRIGAIANMIHPLSSENEIFHYINDTQSRAVVVIDMAASKIRNIMPQTKLEHVIAVSVADSMPFFMSIGYAVTQGRKNKTDLTGMITWKQWMKQGEKGSRLANVPFGKTEDVAAILYSGGTSGTPKGIELTNMNFNALAVQGIEACVSFEAKDRMLSIMPIFHGFGLGICIHSVQYIGGTSILLPRFLVQTFDKLLKKYKPNIIAGVPTLFEALLLNKNFEGVDLSFLKCVISGGDSLSVSLKHKVDEFLKAHGAYIQVREGYGLTECVTGSCLTPKNEYREGSIGIPYPDTYYKIVKPNTEEELPYGEEGEIVLAGPTVMKGYLDNEKETAEVLRTHSDGLVWLHTGDLGYMDEEGFVYFKHRLKRVIMSSGYCVYPQYIENILDSHPAVFMSCVIGIDHAYKKQVPKAYIVLKDNKEPDELLRGEIRRYCEESLARYQWPAEYEFRSELPKTLVGKIAYSELEKENRADGR